MSPVEELRNLPPEEPSRDLDARVRRAAHAELAAATGPSWLALAARFWNGVALPAAVTVTVVGYLHWAFVAANALYR
jgi:hypothetical protein